MLKSRRHNGELLQTKLHSQEGLRIDLEFVQPPAITDVELLQAWAPRRGNGVAKLGSMEADAAQIEHGEPGKDTSGRHSEAEKS